MGWDDITTKKVEPKQVQAGNVVFPDKETRDKILGPEVLDGKKEAEETSNKGRAEVVPLSGISSPLPSSLPTSKKSEGVPEVVRREYISEPVKLLNEKTGIIMPATTVEGVKKWQDTFNKIKAAIIDPKKDVEVLEIFNKKTNVLTKVPFIKKSGWRKLATAFNLVDEILYEEKIVEKPTVYTWKFAVRIIAPNGRTSVGVGMCSTKEFTAIRKEHDIYATAHTRAKNRGISDLIGGGETSYEEMNADVKSEGGE